jgi:UDPglucose 6-dehydrogenase
VRAARPARNVSQGSCDSDSDESRVPQADRGSAAARLNEGSLLVYARRVAVIGTGYVGLTTGACLASLGHRVSCADVDPGKVDRLPRGQVGIREEGLAELVVAGIAAGRLSFLVGATAAPTDLAEHDGSRRSRLPLRAHADGRGRGCRSEGRRSDAIVVNKSTVPVGTAARTAELLNRDDVTVVSNPEFLREGSAVRDFLHPDRIVVGATVPEAAERVAALYARLSAPTVLTGAASAEMIKYAANCFLAMKLSYVNALAEMCARLDADIVDVTDGMGFDRRIGQSFMHPGPGWGGSCLPKDTNALLEVADSVDFEFRLLRATIETNTRQFQRIVDKIRVAVTGRCQGSLGRRRLTLLGLTFKASTDGCATRPRSRWRRCCAVAPGWGRTHGLRPWAARDGTRSGVTSHLGGRRPLHRREGRRCHCDPHGVARISDA